MNRKTLALVFLLISPFVTLPKTVNAQIYITSRFLPGPDSGYLTADCKTSTINPNNPNGPPAPTNNNYNNFSVYCTVTPSDGSPEITSASAPGNPCPPLALQPPNVMPTQVPTVANKPTAECQFDFPTKPGVSYAINSLHFLWLKNGPPGMTCDSR